MRLRHPLARAYGLGSSGEGVHHWWMQRLSSLALLFLVPWFVVFVIGLLGADYMSVRLSIAQPLNAIGLILFAIALFHHAWLGVQVVIEDYVGSRWVEVTCHVLVRFTYLAAAVASIFAIVRVALSVG